VGPWNLSTIESDFMRPPLEIGSGSQWAYMVSSFFQKFNLYVIQ
jgi:hypothetical protein